MSDLALFWDQVQGAADLAIVEDDLAADDGLATSVLLSLFVDRRAEPEDLLPDADLRGFWADEFAKIEGDREGSRLWTILERAKIEPALEANVDDVIRESLAWMIEDQIIGTLGVDVVIDGIALRFAVTITRPQETQNHTWGFLWDGESLNAV